MRHRPSASHTHPAGRRRDITAHREECLGDVVHDGISNQHRCEQADHGQRRADEQGHQQQVWFASLPSTRCDKVTATPFTTTREDFATAPDGCSRLAAEAAIS
jgi:hypothetical protein